MILNNISLDFGSPVPVFEQIKRQIKQAIATGIVKEGETLPSIREMATFLQINPNTVARSYRELVQETIIDGRAGKGFWIAETSVIQDQKIGLLTEEFKRFLERAVAMGFSRDQVHKLIEKFLSKGDSDETTQG